MADKAPAHPTQPDHQNNVLVYSVGSEYQGNASTLQTPINQNKPTTVYYRTNKFDPSAGVSVDSVRPVLVESVCASSSGSAENGITVSAVDNENCEYKPEAISPPFGWKRILSNGIIIYVSPSNTALSSLEQVKCYVQSDGTCKCGLECPLHIPLAFNFDPKVLTKPYSPTVIAPGELTKLCNHKRKLNVNMETLSNDSRFGVADVLRRKKRRVLVTGGVSPVIIGNNQTAGPGAAVLQSSASGGPHGVVAPYQGVNSPMSVPHGTSLQHGSNIPQGGALPQGSSLPHTMNLPPGVNLMPGSNIQHQSASPVPLGVQPPNSVVGLHPGQGVSNSNPALLNMQQGVNMQPNSNPITMQQNVILGLHQNAANQVGVHTTPPLGMQQNVTAMSMPSNSALQQNSLMQQAASVNPSPSASPALSGGSLPPPSPLSTRMTPPIASSSSSRSDLHNSQFVKMQQQIPSHEVWRESNYSNGFLEYMGSSGGGGMLPESPSASQDSSILQQHQIQNSPSPDLSSSMVPTPGPGEEVPQPNLTMLTQNQILAQNIVQSNSSVPQASSIPLMPPTSQVLSHVVQNSGQELSASMGQNAMSVPQGAQPTMVRRFPVQVASQSPSHSSPSTYQISNNQPLQVQYDSSRVCPPGYSVKYTKKSNNHIQQQIIEDHQLALSHPQTISSYQNNMQSSSQHFSHQQVVSNHQLIVSSQQNVNSQQQIVNTQQNIDQTSIAVQQNINNQQNIQSLMASKQHSNSQVHCVNNQEVGSSSNSNIGRVRTPPWHQNKRHQQEVHHQLQPQPVEKTSWTRKSKPKDEGSPSFLEDPSGYLAQQTAMLRQVVAGREDEEGPKTMASGHTASSNTLTSVLAGRTNTLTVSVGSQEPKPQQHILVSGNGQFIIAAAPKVNPPSPLLLPAPLLLQPIDTVQLPQLVVPSSIHEEVLEKRKSPNKKRKLSPTTTTTTMLLSPQPQQQVLTILPGKSPIANMIQPLNVVQNFPIQQFLVPSMVMSDGTILQDTVQVNLLPSAGVFSSGQNIITPASVVLRAPTTSQTQPPQPPKFIHSPNHQFVNFSGDLSSQVVPATTNTTVVQQNTTTIVQQTTMVQQPSPSYILDKPNFILAPDKNNFILNPNGNNGNSEKTGRPGFVRNSVSTQTQNQVVQVSSTGPGGLMVTTGGSRGSSPPDTTTLSPADQEVSTSVTSPDPSMVHCVSSSNLQDDSSPYHIDTTTSIPYQSGNGGKPVSYDEAYLHQPLQDKDISQMSSDDCSGKMLCTTTSSGSPLDTLEESDGLVN